MKILSLAPRSLIPFAVPMSVVNRFPFIFVFAVLSALAASCIPQSFYILFPDCIIYLQEAVIQPVFILTPVFFLNVPELLLSGFLSCVFPPRQFAWVPGFEPVSLCC